MKQTQKTHTMGRACARILPVLEALGYHLTFGEPGIIRVAPVPTEQDRQFIDRCWNQISDELCERLVDGYPYEVETAPKVAQSEG